MTFVANERITHPLGSSAPGKKRLKALVADDDSTIKALITEVARMEHYETETASDGQEAYYNIMWALARCEPFDLVVSDMVMPLMSGDELLQRIKNLYDNLPTLLGNLYTKNDPQRLPFFLGMSGYDQNATEYDTRVAAYSKNSLAFLQKPFSIPAFRKILSNGVPAYLSS
ncbi:MAG TPA: response regulator [archaeon]|nr:response regulator [archaeon]